MVELDPMVVRGLGVSARAGRASFEVTRGESGCDPENMTAQQAQA